MSSRETEVLELLGEGLHNIEIARRLFLSESTVRTYIRRLMEKLNLKNRVELATFHNTSRQNDFERLAEKLKSAQAAFEINTSKASGSSGSPVHQKNEPSSVFGERRSVTLLAVEIEISHHAFDEEETTDIDEAMRICLGTIVEEVPREGGTVGWFTGSGAVCMFGVPRWYDDAALRAAWAAVAIKDRLSDYAKQCRDMGMDLEFRLALNTGSMDIDDALGASGPTFVPVGNTAKRAIALAEAAKPGHIWVANSTYRLTEHYFIYHPVGQIHLRGETRLGDVFELQDLRDVKSRLGPAISRGLTPFVGRETELDHLRRCYGLACNGKGQMVGIVGEPGTGKSRLVLEFVKRLPRGEHHYVEGRCLDYTQDVMTYRYLRDILGFLFGIHSGDSEHVIKERIATKLSEMPGDMTGILPPLYEALALPVEDEEYLHLDLTQRKAKYLEMVKLLCGNASRDKPLIIVVEDMQWIQKSAAELIENILSWLPGYRILLLTIYRPEYSHGWANKSCYSQLRVDPLDSEQTAQMIQSVVEDAAVEPEAINFIRTRSEGVPFYVEELILSMIETEILRKESNRYVLTSTIDTIPFPDTIQGLIYARMDRLEPGLKRILQAASVLGREFNLDILQAVLDVGADLVLQLQKLLQLEFIYEKDVLAPTQYAFRHALTQRTIYDSLTGETRKSLHQNAGAAIERLYPNRPEEFCEALAHHYVKATVAEKACGYFEMAGQKAVRSHAYWEAIDFYREAMRSLTQLPKNDDRRGRELELLFGLETPLRILTYPQGSLECLQRIEHLCQEMGDIAKLTIAKSSIGWYHATQGNMPCSLEYAESAFALALKSGDEKQIVMTSFDLCGALMMGGDFKRLAHVALPAIELIEKMQKETAYFGGPFNTNAYVGISSLYGLALSNAGRFEEARTILAKATRIASTCNDLFSLAFAEHFYSVIGIWRGDMADTWPHVSASKAAFEKLHCDQLFGAALGLWSLTYLYESRSDLARKEYAHSLALRQAAGTPFLEPAYLISGGIIELCAGDLGKTRNLLEEAISRAVQTGHRGHESYAKVYLGRLWGRMAPPNFDKAEELIREGIAIEEDLGMIAWAASHYSFLGEVYLDAGRTDAAREVLLKAEAMCSDMKMDFWLRRARRLLKRLENV